MSFSIINKIVNESLKISIFQSHKYRHNKMALWRVLVKTNGVATRKKRQKKKPKTIHSNSGSF